MAAATDTDTLVDVVRARARAESREIVAMLDFRDTEMARTAHVEPPMRRHVERSAIALTIGEAARLSEGQVVHRLAAADRVRQHTPAVWAAFTDGRIDWARVRDIAATIARLRRAESIARLDQRVVDYATGHTTAELRAWLRRFVQRVEADLAVERANDARRGRHVSVRHDDDSMGWLHAYLPSHELAAIEARLRREARRDIAPDDDRTIAQREADLLIAWCTSSTATTAAVDANIAVTIAADVLAGAVAGFAESSDGRWAVPAEWITTIAATGNTFWHRIVTRPGGTRPPASAASQAAWCERQRASGVSGEARAAPAYHRVPHPEGRTRADNLGPLCRRHHTYKSHGILRWTSLPPPSPPPPRPPRPRKPLVVETFHHPIFIQYAAA